MEAAGRPEDGLCTFAAALEWPDLNFHVIHFNGSVVTWTISQGESEKASNPSRSSPPTRCLHPSFPAHSISSAGLLPTLRGFGYKFIFIDRKSELMYSVLLSLSPLQCVSILGSGTKVSAAIYSRGRCTMPSAWVGTGLPG